MKELDACLRDLVAAIRAVYQPTLAHDALVRAAIAELTQLEEPMSPAPLQTPRPELACTSYVPAARSAPMTVGAATEQAILDILSPKQDVGRISDVFDRKESELRALFCSLRPLEAAALRKRLSDSSDKLAEVFSRFAPERRARLIAVLADARRREALQHARGRVAAGGAR